MTDVAEVAANTFVRATVIYEDKKADLLLPGALPVAELIPTIIRRLAAPNQPAALRGFVLSTADGTVVDRSQSLNQQNFHNGAIFELTHRTPETQKRYDDVVEAVADAVDSTNREWTPTDSAGLACAGTVVLLVAATVLLIQARPSAGILVPLTFAGLAALLFGVIWVLERAERHTHAVALALTACLLVGGAGWTFMPAPVAQTPLALSGLGLALAGGASLVMLSEWRELALIPVVLGTTFGTVGAFDIVLGDQQDRVAVGAAAVLCVLLLVLPQLALRTSRLENNDPLLRPMQRPATGSATVAVSGEEVRKNYLRGRRTLFAVRIAAGAALALLTPWVVAQGPWSLVILGALLVILTLGSRTSFGRMDVMSQYVLALVILTVACVSVAILHPLWWPVLVIVMCVLAAGLIAFGLVIGATPPWMRQLADVVEATAGIVIIPAAVLAMRLW